MKHTAIGLLVGVVLALPAARVLGFALYGVAPYDPTVFVSILAVLAGAGTLGCWLPARRATRMNPVEALAAD
jgi:ABC-type antimicrobial peptide transport system permease subunit